MRLCPFIFMVLAQSVSAGEGPTATAYPHWDGQESIERYAERVHLPPADTLDLGNGVKLELVLIPAGQFLMGAPEPEAVDKDGILKQILLGQALLAAGGGVLLLLLGAVAVQAIRKRIRPKYSLARLLAMTAVAGVAVLGGMHWRHSAQAGGKIAVAYATAKARYDEGLADEKPAHLVTLTRPFYMGKFEVTQEQYQAVSEVNPSHFKGQNKPVENVSWDDARGFCKRVSEQTKRTVRLATESEWEYSCRAGTRTEYYSGDVDQDLDRVAWHGRNSKNTTHPVGQKEPNAFGLYDMHGNVWEWCQDWYEEKYFSKSPAEDPQGPAYGAFRVLRGGNWGHHPRGCRAACRFGGNPDGLDNFVGFRVVVTPAFRTP